MGGLRKHVDILVGDFFRYSCGGLLAVRSVNRTNALSGRRSWVFGIHDSNESAVGFVIVSREEEGIEFRHDLGKCAK